MTATTEVVISLKSNAALRRLDLSGTATSRMSVMRTPLVGGDIRVLDDLAPARDLALDLLGELLRRADDDVRAHVEHALLDVGQRHAARRLRPELLDDGGGRSRRHEHAGDRFRFL